MHHLMPELLFAGPSKHVVDTLELALGGDRRFSGAEAAAGAVAKSLKKAQKKHLNKVTKMARHC